MPVYWLVGPVPPQPACPDPLKPQDALHSLLNPAGVLPLGGGEWLLASVLLLLPPPTQLPIVALYPGLLLLLKKK